ncbi:unnamed protein product [marine sediment metagenome]|uniref:Uncharacterized protein n=1 Tax=marine sediment metagenome TaxID=412755 RepID=X1RH10_9ZZZZ
MDGIEAAKLGSVVKRKDAQLFQENINGAAKELEIPWAQGCRNPPWNREIKFYQVIGRSVFLGELDFFHKASDTS